MKRQIPVFKFSLGQHQSIGPTQLQALWSRACQSSDVSVGRDPPRLGADSNPVYALYASPAIENLPQVEQRLRMLLEQSHLRASVIALHH